MLVKFQLIKEKDRSTFVPILFPSQVLKIIKGTRKVIHDRIGCTLATPLATFSQYETSYIISNLLV